MRRLCCAAATAALAGALAGGVGAPPAAARPFGVEDLLRTETLGAAALDPSGRRLVYEQRGAYDTARRFDYDQSVVLTLSRLRVVDTAAPGPGRQLLAGDPAGVVMGPFSPSGARLAVFRVAGATWRLGVVTPATGAVRWFPITPQGDSRGRTVQWRDDRTLLVLDRPDGRLPLALHQGAVFAAEMPRRWAAAARGEVSRTAYGSGAYLGVRDRGAPNRLLQVDVTRGTERVLAEGQFIDLDLSPDGRQVALFASGPDLQPQGEAPVRGPAGSETEATRLTLLDLRTGAQRTPCAACDALPQLLAWSPSGRRLLVFVRGPDGLWTDGRLLQVDARTGAAEALAAEFHPHLDLNPATVWSAWLGETPLVYGRAAEGGPGRDDWFALAPEGARNLTADLPAPSKAVRRGGPGDLEVLAGGTLWRIGPTGPAEALARAVSPVAFADLRFGAGARLARAAPGVLWMVEPDAAGGAALLGVGPDDRQVTIRDMGGDWADAALAGVALQRQFDAHGEESLSLTTGARTTRVATVNRGWAALDPPQIVPVRHAGPSGEPLVSWVFLPARSDAAGALPLIVRPYPGSSYPRPPGEASGRLEVYQNLRVLTGRGYAVLVPSLPNPPGGMVEPAERLASRLLGVVQAALDTPALAGRLDPGRLAIMGHSFGGYAVMTGITQTDCFKAAVEMNGISDFTAYWDSLPGHLQLDSELAYWSNWHTGVVERTQPELQVPPWRDPDRYIRNSPLFAADRIHTPLLLIHGGQDGLSVAQSEAMYSALFRQGKDALLLVYWGALHAPSSPGDVRDVYAQTFRFLDDHLGVSGDVGRSSSPEPGPGGGAPKPLLKPPTGCPTASPPR